MLKNNRCLVSQTFRGFVKAHLEGVEFIERSHDRVGDVAEFEAQEAAAWLQNSVSFEESLKVTTTSQDNIS